ncbi:hypothetical protein BaRGS_00024617 [Batillaria attramentaria]|uniref:5' exonuclease Apollo n=1 Tax=Batillaria attramentaria TaxID=370345 RepID=A0ABD0KAL0_9CAEN
MNGHVIPGTGIAVDYWQVHKHTDIKYFFLTHLHGDHVVGLTSTWRHPIYCSLLTAQLLTERYGLDGALLRPLEVGQSHIVYGGHQRHRLAPADLDRSRITSQACGVRGTAAKRSRTDLLRFESNRTDCHNAETDENGETGKKTHSNTSPVGEDGQTQKYGENIKPYQADYAQQRQRQTPSAQTMTVTVIDANHCPGAVMFLFEGDFGKILYTGDFRYKPCMVDKDSLLASHLGTVDRLYLDNTYCSPKCVFPTREEALEEIVRIASEHRDCDILLGLRGLGKEELVAAVALALDEWVCVPPKMLALGMCLGLPNVFRTAQSDLRIRVVPFHSVSGKSMRECNKAKRTIAILPTALYQGIDGRPFANQPDVFIVPYSDHSSYPELLEFVSKVRPASVVPIVRGKVRGPFGVDVSDRESMNCFKQFLSEPGPRYTCIPSPEQTVPCTASSVQAGTVTSLDSAASFDSLFLDFTPWTTQPTAAKRSRSTSKQPSFIFTKRKNSCSKGVTYLPDEEHWERDRKTDRCEKPRSAKKDIEAAEETSDNLCKAKDSERNLASFVQQSGSDTIDSEKMPCMADAVIVIDDADECQGIQDDDYTESDDSVMIKEPSTSTCRKEADTVAVPQVAENQSIEQSATHTKQLTVMMQSETASPLADGVQEPLTVTLSSCAASCRQTCLDSSAVGKSGRGVTSCNRSLSCMSESLPSKLHDELGFEKLLFKSKRVLYTKKVSDRRLKLVKDLSDLFTQFSKDSTNH